MVKPLLDNFLDKSKITPNQTVLLFDTHPFVLYYKIGIFFELNGGSHVSNTEKTRTTVDIYGQQYVIIGTETEGHIRQVASLVDKKLREIGSRNPSLDVNKLAVLTAVNAVNDYIKIKEQLERLQAELQKEKD